MKKRLFGNAGEGRRVTLVGERLHDLVFGPSTDLESLRSLAAAARRMRAASIAFCSYSGWVEVTSRTGAVWASPTEERQWASETLMRCRALARSSVATEDGLKRAAAVNLRAAHAQFPAVVRSRHLKSDQDALGDEAGCSVHPGDEFVLTLLVRACPLGYEVEVLLTSPKGVPLNGALVRWSHRSREGEVRVANGQARVTSCRSGILSLSVEVTGREPLGFPVSLEPATQDRSAKILPDP